MPITSASMSYVLDEVTSSVAFETFFEAPFMMPFFYAMRGSTGRRERFTSLGGVGKFQPKTPMAAPDLASVVQQFQKTFVHGEFALQVPVERSFVDDQEWGVVEDIGRQLGDAASQTMEEDAAALFNDAFLGASYTAEDSLPICYSAHVNSAGGNSQANAGATGISMASIKSTRTLMRKFTNYGGEKRSINPDILVVPIAIEEEAWEIANSQLRPDGTNWAANIYNGMFQIVTWPFLSDDDNWFMIDSRLMKANLLWFQRIPLEIFGDGDLFTGTKRIAGYYRESHGCRDWRWIFGHSV